MTIDAIMRIAPVIPVIVIEEEAHAVPLAEALVAGGLRVLEVTLRTPAALGAILIPMMANSGYDRAKSAGLVASANLVSPIMPPSVPFIVYGVAAGVSIKSLFMGGIAPAIYLTAVMCIIWFIVSRKDNIRSTDPRPTAGEAAKIFVDGLWALLLPIIILVGLRSGIFTATEAGVVAVVYALIVGIFVYRELKLPEVFTGLVSGAKMSAVVMFLATAIRA